MNITIKQSGFVTGDFLNPVGYSGEMNARQLNITHPLFENAFYQLIIIKENRPYILGIQDGKVILPPSLTDICACLECQFIAIRKNDELDLALNNCDCYPSSTNDCQHMIFKSDKFTLKVAQGLNLNGLTPIPPYETLVDMYNNIGKAKLIAEKSTFDNMKVADSIDEKIKELQNEDYMVDLQKESKQRKDADVEINKQIQTLLNNYKDKYQIIIDNVLQGKAIRDMQNNIILTDTVVINSFIISPDITIIIPRNKTLILNTNAKLKIEGTLTVSGKVMLKQGSVVEITGNVTTNDFYNDFIFDNPSAIINIISNSSIKNNQINIFGNGSFDAKIGSSIKYVKANDNKIFDLSGEAIISTGYDYIIINEDKLNIDGSLEVDGVIKLYNDSQIMIENNSLLDVKNNIQVYDDGNIIGINNTSELKIDALAEVTDFEADKIYIYDNNEWVEKEE